MTLYCPICAFPKSGETGTLLHPNLGKGVKMNHVRDAFTNQGYDVYYVFECPECGYERYKPAQ